MANLNHQLGNRMQIETLSAVAALRGTEFRVAAEGDIALQETARLVLVRLDKKCYWQKALVVL